MCISDPKDAERKLSKINYYRFTGYALSLRGDREGNRYVSGTDFDMVYRLYLFDEELRNALIDIFKRYEEIILKSEIGLPERYEYILNREIK